MPGPCCSLQGWECTPRFGWRGVWGRVGRGLPGHPAPGKPWLRLGKTTVRPSAWRRGNRLPGCSSRLCRQLLEASPQPGLMKLRLGLLICQNLENGRVELVSAVSICSSRQLSRRLAPKSPLGPSAHGGEDRLSAPSGRAGGGPSRVLRPQDVRAAGPRVAPRLPGAEIRRSRAPVCVDLAAVELASSRVISQRALVFNYRYVITEFLVH